MNDPRNDTNSSCVLVDRSAISVVVPAFNEEACLGETLARLNQAKNLLKDQRNIDTEIIVVDNESGDRTVEIAKEGGATVLSETRHNVGAVRNSGARASHGDVLVFVDADTLTPRELLVRIAETMSDQSCVGGAVDTEYQPQKLTIKIYLGFWRALGRMFGMAQGATQFCRRESFFTLGGYDENLFMGEDVDFYWRVTRHAKQERRKIALIDDVKVVPSSRRFDRWPVWRTLLWTNPLFILLFRRRPNFWSGWYKSAPR